MLMLAAKRQQEVTDRYSIFQNVLRFGITSHELLPGEGFVGR